MTDPNALKQAVMLAMAPIADDLKEVERIISEEMASSVGQVEEIARYITSAGGKRMRPALLLLMARAMGADPAKAAFLGAVIEILHTATLMHDDVVDEGMMRRGRATANAQWGNAKAVLVGDFFYTRSFQMMVRAGNLKVMQALSDAANRLSEGEVLQMNNAHDPHTDEARYFAVSERKTACLFEAAAHMAAAVAEAPAEQEDACARYALHLGNAFQITDDILDYRGEAATIGIKPDTESLIENTRCAAPDEMALIDSAIRNGDGDFEAIRTIVVKSGALEMCRKRALEEAERGVQALNALPSGQFKDSLVQFIFLSVQRDR